MNLAKAFIISLKCLNHLKRKIGPVLVQLPPALKFDHEKAETLYRLCKKSYAYYKFTLGIRHESWLTD